MGGGGGGWLELRPWGKLNNKHVLHLRHMHSVASRGHYKQRAFVQSIYIYIYIHLIFYIYI